MSENAQTQERFEERWTYIGPRLEYDGRLYHNYLTPDGRELSYGKPLTPSYARPGSVWIMCGERRDGKTFVTKSGQDAPSYAGMTEDEAQVLTWAARSRTDEVEFEARKRAKKENAAADAFTAACLPLAQQYQKIIGTASRAAFLASVMQAITNPANGRK